MRDRAEIDPHNQTTGYFIQSIVDTNASSVSLNKNKINRRHMFLLFLLVFCFVFCLFLFVVLFGGFIYFCCCLFFIFFGCLFLGVLFLFGFLLLLLLFIINYVYFVVSSRLA